jgi:hypothetical protein
MLEKTDRKRVNGFLRASGTKIVNGVGEEILLTGWGLGNWLLCEGYMWKFFNSPGFDRPRTIEAVVRDIAGSDYAASFWKKFRANYITREDIKKMADLGYNSVRIPFNWRVLMEDEPGEIIFKEDGLALLDNCIDWCEEYHIYAFLDLHGAPGGQTGANIDDSADNLPRLFTDRDYWDKGIALWEKLAERYAGRWIVGGYDLLNEPLRTASAERPDTAHLVPKLAEFYEEAIAAIRKIDKKHLFSIEGHHWATTTEVFYKKFDDNRVIHFHRYGCQPELASYQQVLRLSERLNVPLWLGETGENNNPWYSAMYPLALTLDIGYNIWPWKKMDCTNSPYSVKTPKKWNLLIDFIAGGAKPGKKDAIGFLDEYLENMKLKNCVEHREVVDAVFRRPSCTLQGTDFDALPGKGVSYSGLRKETNFFNYRQDCGMAIHYEEPDTTVVNRGFQQWNKYVLELKTGEFAAYTIYQVKKGDTLRLDLRAAKTSRLSVSQDGAPLGEFEAAAEGTIPAIPLNAGKESVIRITVDTGKVFLRSLNCNRGK